MGLRFDYPYQFERLWRVYPLKVQKLPAFKAFEKLKLSDPEVDELILHVEERKRCDLQWLKDGKGRSFIPHLATFLNQRRWEDEYRRTRRHPAAARAAETSAPTEPGRRLSPDEVRAQLSAIGLPKLYH